MYINGFNFIEVRPGVWVAEESAAAQVRAKDGGWVVVTLEGSYRDPVDQPTFGDALQAASEVVAKELAKPRYSYAVVEGYGDEAEQITEYRNRRLAGQATARYLGIGEDY